MRKNDDLSRALRQLTPKANSPDAVDVAFRAGRASAGTGRVWKSVAGLLAASQLLTLALWLPGGPANDPSPSRVPIARDASAPEKPRPPRESYTYAALRGRESELPPGAGPAAVTASEPLTARSVGDVLNWE